MEGHCMWEFHVSTRRNSTDGIGKFDPRKRARADAQRIINKGYGDLLVGSFEHPIVEECQDNLQAFVADICDDENARGLERYLSMQHKEERDVAREEHMEAVLARQSHLRKNKTRRRSSRTTTTADDMAERIRVVSRRFSKTGRAFARRMGIADEFAVQVDCEVEEDEDEEEPVQSYLPLPRLQESQTPFGSSTNSQSSNHPSQSKSLTSNAKMACRQPSLRELNVGIRSTLAGMNAKKAMRQESIRQLNVSIRNLANTFGSSRNVLGGMDMSLSKNNSSNHSRSQKGSSWTPMSNSSHMQQPQDDESNNHNDDDMDASIDRSNLFIHPSRMPRGLSKRDLGLKAPMRRQPSACTLLLQNALDVVDDEEEDDDEDSDDKEEEDLFDFRRRNEYAITV